MSNTFFQEPARWEGDLAVPTAIAKTPLTETEARALVEQIRAGIHVLRRQVYELYEKRGWESLGYNSWWACIDAEFPQSQPRLHQELQAARVEIILYDRIEKIGSTPEWRIRPLAPLLDSPDKVREAYAAASSATNGRPTGKAVRAAVDKVLERRAPPIAEPRAEPAKRHFDSAFEDDDGLEPDAEYEHEHEPDDDEAGQEEDPRLDTTPPLRSAPKKSNGAQMPIILTGPGPAFPKVPGCVSTAAHPHWIRDLNQIMIEVDEHDGIDGSMNGVPDHEKELFKNTLIRFCEHAKRWISFLEGGDGQG